MASSSNETRPTLHFFVLSRFHHDSEGALRTLTPPLEVERWEPFLTYFSKIVIYARVDTETIIDQGARFSHPRIDFVPIPYYSGALSFIRNLPRIRRFLISKVNDPMSYYGLWLPNPLSLAIAKKSSRINAPLLTIAIGDPQGVSAALFRGWIGRFISLVSARNMRKTVELADAAIYVTLETLQRQYPARCGVPTLARTDVVFPELPKDFRPPSYAEHPEKVSLIAVGSQEANYKGHDLLIESVAILQSEGYKLELTLVGSGSYHEILKLQAVQIGAEEVTFVKRVGDCRDVAQEVAKHDIFLMPSRTEGMPKALLEAMSTGVFALGSNVGGMPEVLSEECVFEAGSLEALTERLRYYLDDWSRITPEVERQRQMIELIRERHSGDAVLRGFLGQWTSLKEIR